MALKIYINHDIEDEILGFSGVDWIEVNVANDGFIFSQGSLTVADEAIIPSAEDLNQASVLLEATEKVVPKYFLSDLSAGKLKEIFNAGNQNKRYVFCFNFNAATASEPVLEAWENAELSTIDLQCLGNGVANDSWYKAICTTDALPGANWVGTALAGSAVGNVVLLNNGNGALSTAKNLYINFKVVIPVTASDAGVLNPVLVVKYTTN